MYIAERQRNVVRERASSFEDYLRDLPESALMFAEELHGKERFAARKLIVSRLEEFGQYSNQETARDVDHQIRVGKGRLFDF